MSDALTITQRNLLVWRKLAVNCAINPLTALLGVPNGALVDDPAACAELAAAAREVGAVAAARGIMLGVDAGTNVAREFWPRRPAKH